MLKLRFDRYITLATLATQARSMLVLINNVHVKQITIIN